jgi:DNA polymerase-3 subunit alpha
MDERVTYPGSLHNHTMYSNLRLRDCIIRENELIDYALELGHEVVAITDHESISNAIKVEKYYQKVKKNNPNFKVILGNEIYLCKNGLNNQNFIPKQDRYYHFVLLAKDAIGHQQIREISTRAWTRSYMARGMRRVPTYYQDLFDIIGNNPGHVIGSTACLGGALPTQLLNYKDTKDEGLLNKIRLWIKQMDNIFGHGNFFFEMQPSNNKEQIYVNRSLLHLSNEFNIPYIITTDSHYLKKEDRKIHKAYLNAQNGDREVDDFYASTYMMGTEEIKEYFNYFQDYELEMAFENIRKIKDMCEDYSLQKSLNIPKLVWKEPTLNKDFLYDRIKDMEKYIPELHNFYYSDYDGDKLLAELIVERIYQDKDLQEIEVYNEINDNLKMTRVSSEVNKTHWSAYYLNLQKIIDICWEAGSLVGPGRGSGVGFILLYVLGITQINPLKESTKTFAWRLTRKGSKVSYLW